MAFAAREGVRYNPNQPDNNNGAARQTPPQPTPNRQQPPPAPETRNGPQTPEQEAEGKLHELARRALTPIGEYARHNNADAQMARDGVWNRVLTVMGLPEGPTGSRVNDKVLRIAANGLIFVIATAGDKLATAQIEKLEQVIAGPGGPGLINTVRHIVGAAVHYGLERVSDRIVGAAPNQASEYATGRPYPREMAELIAAVANAFPVLRNWISPTNVEAGVRILAEFPLAGVALNYAYQRGNEVVAAMNQNNVVNTGNIGHFARVIGTIYSRARGTPGTGGP